MSSVPTIVATLRRRAPADRIEATAGRERLPCRQHLAGILAHPGPVGLGLAGPGQPFLRLRSSPCDCRSISARSRYTRAPLPAASSRARAVSHWRACIASSACRIRVSASDLVQRRQSAVDALLALLRRSRSDRAGHRRGATSGCGSAAPGSLQQLHRQPAPARLQCQLGRLHAAGAKSGAAFSACAPAPARRRCGPAAAAAVASIWCNTALLCLAWVSSSSFCACISSISGSASSHFPARPSSSNRVVSTQGVVGLRR